MKDTLVVCFSRTGYTRRVAGHIVGATGARLMKAMKAHVPGGAGLVGTYEVAR